MPSLRTRFVQRGALPALLIVVVSLGVSHIGSLPLVPLPQRALARMALTMRSVFSREDEEAATQRLAIAEASELEQARERIAELEGLLDYEESSGHTLIAAHVLARVEHPWKNAVLLDIGKRNLVHEGDPVISGEGIFIGIVTEVFGRSALVRLLSDHTSTVAVHILGKTSSESLLKGTDGSLASLEFIPQELELSPNDVLVTSGLQARIPAGLPVGIVLTVNQDPVFPFQQADVELLDDVLRAQSVGILILPEGEATL